MYVHHPRTAHTDAVAAKPRNLRPLSQIFQPEQLSAAQRRALLEVEELLPRDVEDTASTVGLRERLDTYSDFVVV